MRSRDARAALFCVVCTLAVAGVASPLWQSGIPRSFDGTVDRVEVRFEKRPGSDDVYLVTVDGRRVILDRSVARPMEEGQQVRKRAWSRQISIDGRSRTIALSREAKGLIAIAPAAPLLALVLLDPGRFAIGRRERPRWTRDRTDLDADDMAGTSG